MDDPAAKNKTKISKSSFQIWQIFTLMGFILGFVCAAITGVAIAYSAQSKAALDSCSTVSCPQLNNCSLVACINGNCELLGEVPGCCTDSTEQTCVSRDANYNFDTIRVNTVYTNNDQDIITLSNCVFGLGILSCRTGISEFNDLDVSGTLSVDKISPHTVSGTITFTSGVEFTGLIEVNTIDPVSGSTITLNGGTVSVVGTTADFTGFVDTNFILPHSGSTITINSTTLTVTATTADFSGIIRVNTITTHTGSVLTLNPSIVDLTGTLQVNTITSHTPNGNITMDAPILLKGNSVSGYVASTLDYYEEANVTFEFSGAFQTSTIASVFFFTRFGSVVNVQWATTTDTCSHSNAIFTMTGAIPSRFQPRLTSNLVIVVEDNSVVLTTPGLMSFSSNGQVAIFKQASGSTSFTGSGTCGFLLGSNVYMSD
jgi:hypothetical protein